MSDCFLHAKFQITPKGIKKPRTLTDLILFVMKNNKALSLKELKSKLSLLPEANTTDKDFDMRLYQTVYRLYHSNYIRKEYENVNSSSK